MQTSENFTYGFVPGPVQVQCTNQTQMWHQKKKKDKKKFRYFGFQKKFDTPHSLSQNPISDSSFPTLILQKQRITTTSLGFKLDHRATATK